VNAVPYLMLVRLEQFIFGLKMHQQSVDIRTITANSLSAKLDRNNEHKIYLQRSRRRQSNVVLLWTIRFAIFRSSLQNALKHFLNEKQNSRMKVKV